MKPNSKIYLAGHDGLVGSAILRNLKTKGYNNFVFTPYPEFDLTNQQTTADFFKKEKPEYVFLAAAKVGGILANSTYQADFIYDNVMISTNIIHASYKYGVKKLLNLGSSCIYPKHAPQPLKEEYLLTGLLEPTNEPYAIAKITAIKMCRYFNEQYGTNFISVMPTNLYGPGDNFNLETSHVLPAMLRKFHLAKCLENNDWESVQKDLNKRPIENIDGNSTQEDILRILNKYGIKQSSIVNRQSTIITLWGTGSPRREFLYVDDLADAVVFLMNNYNTKDIGEFVNIGTRKDLTIKELAKVIKEIVGFKGKINWDYSKPDGTPKKLLNVERLHNLKWDARISLKKGLKIAYAKYNN